MDLKEKLAGAEREISAKRDERKQLLATRDEARDAFAAIDGFDTDSAEFKAAESAVAALGACDDELTGLTEARTGILRMLADSDPAATPPTNGEPAQRAEGWDSSRLVSGEGFDALAALARSTAHIGHRSLGEVITRDAFAAELGSDDVAGLIQPDRRGLLPPLYPALTLLQLMNVGTTSSNLVEYVQVTKLAQEAVEVSEGALKPEASITLEDADAPIRTIAEWLKVRKQTLADADTLRSFIDTSLRFDVQNRLNGQIIAGDGTGENIEGLLEQPILEPAVSGSDADRILRGKTVVTLALGNPSVVILNPYDDEAIRLSREDTGGAGTGGYLMGPPSASGASTLWGLRTVTAPQVPQGTAIVADLNGALVLIREGVNVLVSDSDGDDFTHNRVTILAEMRAGLVVQRPDYFAAVDLSAS